MREATVEQYLVSEAERRGGVAEKVKVAGKRGFFDRLVVMPHGRVFFVELKRPKGGVLSPHQRDRISLYRALCAQVFVIRSIDDVDEFFDRYDLTLRS